MIDVSALVGDIPPTTITVRTFAVATPNVYGEREAASADATRTAVVHPSGRRELERLGLDTRRETISVYVTEALGTVDDVRPPEIQYGGRWYVTVRVGDYGALGGLYLIHAALLDGVTEAAP